MTKRFEPGLILICLSLVVACVSQRATENYHPEQLVVPAASPAPMMTPWPSTYVPCDPELKAKQIQEAFARDPVLGSQRIKILYVGSGSAGPRAGVNGQPDSSFRQETDFLYESRGSKYTGHIEFDLHSCSAGRLTGGFEMLPVR